jgi:hypothetical protein
VDRRRPAVIAVIAGVRPGICKIAVPRSIVDVRAPIHDSSVGTSDPYASAAQADENPSDSAYTAVSTRSATSGPAT